MLFSKYFSNEEVNTKRQIEIDMLKAWTILFIIVEHVYTDLSECDTIILHIIEHVDLITAAQVFMLCMGLGMRYSRSQDLKGLVLRGVELLTVGQVLNIFRNAIPALVAYWITDNPIMISNALLIIQADILSFAGLAFLLIALLKYLKVTDGWMVIIGFAMNLATYIIYLKVPSPDNYLVSQLLGFFIVNDSECFFALGAYFGFVAFGYYLGGVYKKISDKDSLSTKILLIFGPLSIAYHIIRAFVEIPLLPEYNGEDQYILYVLPDSFFSCITTIFLLALLYKISKICGERFFNVVKHLSKHINEYYCISYMFILPLSLWLIAFKGSLFTKPLTPLFYYFLVIFLTYLVIELNEKKLHIHFKDLKGKQKVAVYVIVWAVTVLVVIYAYPRITEYANVWNGYLIE